MLNVSESSTGRFAASVASLKDLNGDSLSDVAVGAPLENEGVVYIYLGDRTYGINPEHAPQVSLLCFPQTQTLCFCPHLTQNMFPEKQTDTMLSRCDHSRSVYVCLVDPSAVGSARSAAVRSVSVRSDGHEP